MMAVLDNFRSSAWIYLTPLAAVCAPIGVLRTYFNQHLRRPMRRFLPFLDPFVTVDIAAKPEDHFYAAYSRGWVKSSDAYTEVLAYLSEVCSREARELRAEGAAEGHGFVLSLREGQTLTCVSPVRYSPAGSSSRCALLGKLGRRVRLPPALIGLGGRRHDGSVDELVQL